MIQRLVEDSPALRAACHLKHQASHLRVIFIPIITSWCVTKLPGTWGRSECRVRSGGGDSWDFFWLAPTGPTDSSPQTWWLCDFRSSACTVIIMQESRFIIQLQKLVWNARQSYLVGRVADGAQEIVAIHALCYGLFIGLATGAYQAAQTRIRSRLLLINRVNVQRTQSSFTDLKHEKTNPMNATLSELLFVHWRDRSGSLNIEQLQISLSPELGSLGLLN